MITSGGTLSAIFPLAALRPLVIFVLQCQTLMS
jgi:hypothetical protein